MIDLAYLTLVPGQGCYLRIGYLQYDRLKAPVEAVILFFFVLSLPFANKIVTDKSQI